jgi:hypothetical protein
MTREMCGLAVAALLIVAAVLLDQRKRSSAAVVPSLLALALFGGVAVAFGDRITEMGLLGGNVRLAERKIDDAKSDAIKRIEAEAAEKLKMLRWEDVTSSKDHFLGPYEYYWETYENGELSATFRATAVHADDIGADYSAGNTSTIHYNNRAIPLYDGKPKPGTWSRVFRRELVTGDPLAVKAASGNG